jgi:hypothetical protein
MPEQKQLDHEKFTAKKIISLCSEIATFDRFGNREHKEPDIIFRASDLILGMEVTLASYKGDDDDPTFHARKAWEFARNPTFDQRGLRRDIDPKTGKPKIWNRMDERLQARIQEVIDKKCKKTYNRVARLWLGIYAYAPLTESYEYDVIAPKVKVPRNNPFERIYVLHFSPDIKRYGTCQLSPENRQFIGEQ